MNAKNRASQRPTLLECTCLVMSAVFWLGTSMSWAQSYYCDDLGNCSGSGIGTYSDSLGNTSGRIGDNSVNVYSDALGNTVGSIGDDRVNLSETALETPQVPWVTIG